MIIKTPPKLTFRSALTKYVEIDLWGWLKDLSVGILQLNFQQNFRSFTVENLTIQAGDEVAISNQFRSSYPGNIPTGRIITRQQGNATVVDGENAWTANHVYLKNPSGNSVTITVIFFL